MKHIEEGTIHAWLDGALSDAEAKEVSQHAASCAECSALVAEARGFIAGASRILTSLDDVPAVAPKRAPVVASAKPQRFWQASPWVTGIAAALILAVGIKEWIDRPSARATFMPVQVAMDSLRAAPIPESKPVDSALRAERRQLTPITNPPPSTLKEGERGKLLIRGTTAQASGVGANSGGLALEKTLQRNEPAKKDAAVEVASAKVAPAAPAPAPQSARQSAFADVADARRDERFSASCYRTGIEVGERADFGPAKAVASREPTVRRAAVSAAPQATAAAEQLAPSIVRVDSTSAGRVVLSPAGLTIGTWTVERDTVRMSLRVVGRPIPLTNRVACTVLDPK